MAFTVNDFEDLLRILKQNPEWQERMRQAILTPELLELPNVVNQLVEAVRELTQAQRQSEARITRLEEVVAELVEAQRRMEAELAALAAAQRRTEETVAQLVEAQRQSEARISRLEEVVAQLVEAQQRTDATVQELVQVMRDALRRLERLENWQIGETGRRDGERYERETLARAPALFFGGRGGGAGEPHIREKVGDWLLPLYRQGVEVPPHDDPLLADIIWWKGDRVMVVEVGLKVSVNDVRRAIARAKTLQQVGVNATPVVIGEEWGTPDTEALAQQEGVEWYVRGGLSKGFLEFRRIGNGAEQTA